MAYRSSNRNHQERSSFREREDSNGGYNIRNMAGRDDTRERSKPFDNGLSPDELGSSEWVHDRYQDDDSHRTHKKREPFKSVDSYRSGPAPKLDTGVQMTIRGLPYDITRSDLQELCERFGNPLDVNLIYDRTDRSTGVAHITYEDPDEAKLAVREIDGAKAYGQVVSASMRAPPPKRSLFERIQHPVPTNNRRNNRERSAEQDDSESGYQSGDRRPRRDRGGRRNSGGDRDRARPALDRYVPPHRGSRDHNSRERDNAPLRPRNTANRVDRKQGRGSDRDRGGRRGGRGERPKKTQEQMDMELDAYFNKGSEDAGAGAAEVVQPKAAAPTATGAQDDMELDL